MNFNYITIERVIRTNKLKSHIILYICIILLYKYKYHSISLHSFTTMSDNPNNLSPPTLDLLCHELKDVVEWDRLAISLKVPYVEVTSIQREYHDVQRCKLHALHKWLQQANNVHSWRTVASAVNDINPAVAEHIKQKYAPIIDKVLEQSTSSPSPPPPPPSPPYNNHTKNNDSNGSNYTLEKKKWLTKKNAIRLLIISLLVGILVGIIACLIVLITRLRASDSALTSPMTITAAPIYMSATSMSSISVSYTNTIMKSSSLVTSSSITSSPSPTLFVSYANTIMKSSSLVTSSSISSSPSPTPSPISGNANRIAQLVLCAVLS